MLVWVDAMWLTVLHELDLEIAYETKTMKCLVKTNYTNNLVTFTQDKSAAVSWLFLIAKASWFSLRFSA